MNQIINLKSKQSSEKKHLLRICFPDFLKGFWVKSWTNVGVGLFPPPPFAPNQKPSTPSP